MIKFACCIPGGSLMPEGIAAVPKSPAEEIVEKCRYLLNIGYDFTECAGGMLAGLDDDGVELLTCENNRNPLKIVSVNSLFPSSWRLSDPDSDKTEYINRAVRIFSIMNKLGVRYAVFGSGAARSIPVGVEREAGYAALVGFIRKIAAEAEKYGVTILIEPLRSSESNIFTTVKESGEFVRALGLGNVKLLFDSFHMAQEGSDVKCVRDYFDIVKHCHIAESPKRSIPGSSDSADLSYNKNFARELISGGYDGCVSVECGYSDFRKDAVSALAYLKEIFMQNTVLKYKAIRNLRGEPVYIKPESGEIGEDITSVRCGDRVFPASKYKDGVIAVISAEAGEELTLTVGYDEFTGCSAEVKDDRVEVKIGGKHFSDYVFSGYNKPFFGQIVDDDGVPFTRLDFETKEHPHQRSLFIAVGDVNGVDCWNEYNNYGLVKNKAIKNVVSASAYASFTAENCWTDLDGKPLITENTTYTVYNQQPDVRVLDIETVFCADYGEVKFGATKEAGPLGIRVRDELRADIGSGQLSNSWGGVGEGECWGRSAEWCDYCGEIDGVGTMGITVFDCCDNERHPTAWHIRAYGLFAANNLYFKGGYTIPAGESVTYKYRVIFRRREMTRCEISDRYVVYTLGRKI
ncbi:MAG: DUF6807 family protein [Eubacteriales bacterium]